MLAGVILDTKLKMKAKSVCPQGWGVIPARPYGLREKGKICPMRVGVILLVAEKLLKLIEVVLCKRELFFLDRF